MEKDYFDYEPSVAVAGVACGLFTLAAIGHAVKLYFYKQKFVICLLAGIIMEIIGFAVRVISIEERSSLAVYAIQSFFILVAPVVFAASIYVTLSKLLRVTRTQDCSFLRPKWITRIFVSGDIISLLLQGAGGGIQAGAKTKNKSDLGSNLAIGGLVVQIIFFSMFIILSGVCHARTAKHYDSVQPKCPPVLRMRPALYYVLYASSLLILIRSIYRVIEYAQGYEGYLMNHEVYLYCLDALLMFILTAITYFFNPGETVHKYLEESENSAFVSNMTEIAPVDDENIQFHDKS